jgi:MFS family permease
MLELNLSDPSNTSFYITIILLLIIILIFLEFIIHILKNRIDYLNSSIDNTLQQGLIYSHTFILRKNTLKFRYLTGYVLTRASMWSKSPYLYTLYSTYHNFEITEIGLLYIIDAISAFICGPLTGNLADKYGRKLFCQLYNFLVIINTLLRMTGNRQLAYLAQIITGISGGLIMTVFESWVVSEANKEFGVRQLEKERFLKKLFKTQNILDAIMSVVISSICALSYVKIKF